MIDRDRGEVPTPLFMDRHDLTGMTMDDVARAHSMDVEIQDDFGVRILTYWFRPGTQYWLLPH